jgi:FeS assembly SUF system protein
VGIFSFLTGKKDDAATSAPAHAIATPPAPVSTPEPPREIHHEADQTPFHPPEAWNIDALTSPRPEPSGAKPEIGPTDPALTAEFQPKVVEALKTVYDPEIPVDIYELGLVYGVDVDAERRVLVTMTLTSPACPSAQQLPSEVRFKIKAIPGVTEAWVEIVWEPPWDKDRMSEAAKLQLGFF